ncbi:MAG: hypothetical protein EPN21_18890 [Methylococcaceae bacterium]|nr:MAG: hypothetical protein EPN21_18890 [Methylococcaceae bacterium]
MACKFSVKKFLEHPVLTSLFVTDFALVLFVHSRFPFILSLILVGMLVYIAMFFGAKFADCFPRATQPPTSA